MQLVQTFQKGCKFLHKAAVNESLQLHQKRPADENTPQLANALPLPRPIRAKYCFWGCHTFSPSPRIIARRLWQRIGPALTANTPAFSLWKPEMLAISPVAKMLLFDTDCRLFETIMKPSASFFTGRSLIQSAGRADVTRNI